MCAQLLFPIQFHTKVYECSPVKLQEKTGRIETWNFVSFSQHACTTREPCRSFFKAAKPKFRDFRPAAVTPAFPSLSTGNFPSATGRDESPSTDCRRKLHLASRHVPLIAAPSSRKISTRTSPHSCGGAIIPHPEIAATSPSIPQTSRLVPTQRESNTGTWKNFGRYEREMSRS